jgi:hypothetical protein
MMATNEKVLGALRTAANYLEKSMLALNQDNEASFADNLWHVAAELEYALFIFSIVLQNEHNPSFKSSHEKVNVKSILEEAQCLLSEAENFAVNGRLLESYKNVYVARNYIRKVQENLAKKKREKIKQK